MSASLECSEALGGGGPAARAGCDRQHLATQRLPCNDCHINADRVTLGVHARAGVANSIYTLTVSSMHAIPRDTWSSSMLFSRTRPPLPRYGPRCNLWNILGGIRKYIEICGIYLVEFVNILKSGRVFFCIPKFGFLYRIHRAARPTGTTRFFRIYPGSWACKNNVPY